MWCEWAQTAYWCWKPPWKSVAPGLRLHLTTIHQLSLRRPSRSWCECVLKTLKANPQPAKPVRTPVEGGVPVSGHAYLLTSMCFLLWSGWSRKRRSVNKRGRERRPARWLTGWCVRYNSPEWKLNNPNHTACEMNKWVLIFSIIQSLTLL